MYLTVFLIFGAAYLFYVFFTWNDDYWRKRNIRGPKPSFIVGNTPSFLFLRKHINYEFDKIYKKYRGKNSIVGFFVLRSPVLMATDPTIIKEILVTNFKHFTDNSLSFMLRESLVGQNLFALQGELWKTNRKQMVGAFSVNRIKALTPLVDSVGDKMKQYIDQSLSKDASFSVDARNLVTRYTTDILFSILYGVDGQTFENEDSQPAKMSRKLVSPFSVECYYMILESLFPICNEFKSFMPWAETENMFKKLMSDSITMRQQSGRTQNDFLDYIMQIREKTNSDVYTTTAMSIQFFVDTYETANLIKTFLLIELAGNVEIQSKLRKEIRNAGDLSYDILSSLPYLDQCVYEILRLHPPLPISAKLCTETIEMVIDNGHKIKIEKGETVNLPMYSLQRDVEYYTQPNEFVPERFDEINGGIKAYKDRGVFYPFGDGPRVCIGMKLGMLIVKAFISRIVRDYSFIIDPKSIDPLKMNSKQVLHAPSNAVYLKLTSIN